MLQFKVTLCSCSQAPGQGQALAPAGLWAWSPWPLQSAIKQKSQAQDGVVCTKVRDTKARSSTKAELQTFSRNVILINQFGIFWSAPMRSLVRWILFTPNPPSEEEEATCLLNPMLFPALQKEGVLAPKNTFFSFTNGFLAHLPHLFSIKAFHFVPFLGAECSSSC